MIASQLTGALLEDQGLLRQLFFIELKGQFSSKEFHIN